MKKVISTTLVAAVLGTALYAGAFEDKKEMMNSRIKSKMEKFKSISAAQDFLEKKLACVNKGKTVADLKACKKEFHPKALKKLVK
jgi:outer membrane murein-binding lipoprotein Lpp